MKKLLLILLCFPLLFSCGDTDNFQRVITEEEIKDGYTGKGTFTSSRVNYGDGPIIGKYVGETLYTGTYVGQFKNGKPYGEGITTFPDGSEYFYLEDHYGSYKYGNGGIHLNNGDKYTGRFENYKKFGFAMMTWANGDKYVGEYKDDKMHGEGTFTFANGSKYVGEWKNDKRHGKGTYTYVYFDYYVGEYKEDKMHGQGTYTFADGKVLKGLFENNEFLGN